MKKNHVTVNNTRLECLGLSLFLSYSIYAALAFTYFKTSKFSLK